MLRRRSIRNRRGRKNLTDSFDLNLTSMLDILTIILVFLLKSHSASTTVFTTLPGMKIPQSVSPTQPPDSLHLIITPEAMTFEDERVVEFEQIAGEVGSLDAKYRLRKADTDEGGRRIVPLYDALLKAKEKAELLRAKSKMRDAEGQPLPFDGVLAIQADNRVNYKTLRKVMYTAGAAGYRVFRLLAERKPQ